MTRSSWARAWGLGRWWLACMGLSVVPGAVGADETLYCGQYIAAVPYTITHPGHYCFAGNLKTSITKGSAIVIRSDSVWLDLNNFSLDGSAAGSATQADGIVSLAQRDVTIRSGVVRGFMFGIDVETGVDGRSVTVEDIRAQGNTVAGIFVNSYPTPDNAAHVVRHNVVTDTGGSTDPAAGAAFGIVLIGGGRVLDNEVMNISGLSPGQAIGIDLREGTVIASGNRVSAADVGIECSSATKYLRDNVAVAATTRAYGPLCTLVGATNYP
jgi:hypothetical protein